MQHSFQKGSFMRFLYFILFFILFPFSSHAQDKQEDAKTEGVNQFTKKNKKEIIKEVKSCFKSSNYKKANEIILNAFKTFPHSLNDIDMCALEMNTQYQLYQEENKKLFLNNKGDTTAFFSHLYQSYYYGLRCDSLSSIIDKDQKKGKYSTEVSNRLSSLRNNLKSGGLYHLKKQNFKEALPFFDIYISTICNPRVYSKTTGSDMNGDSVKTYRMALHSAYGSQQFKKAMDYLPVALTDTTNRDVVMEIVAKSSLQLGDSLTFVKLLKDGFSQYPQNDYFCANLIKFYHDHNDFENTLSVLNKCTEVNNANPKYWKLKGNEYLTIDSLDKSIESFQQVLKLDSTDVEIIAKLGDIYRLKARRFYQSANLKIGSPNFYKNRKILTDLYLSSMSYYEIVRRQRPDEPALWKEGLREAYYRLNKGKELRMLEKH